MAIKIRVPGRGLTTIKSYKDVEGLGRDMYRLSAGQTAKVAKFYEKEVSRRLTQAAGYKPLKATKAYRNITENGTVSGHLDIARRRNGESKANYRNRLVGEIARARRYFAAQTSTKEGFLAWRRNTLTGIAKAAGVKYEDLNRRFRRNSDLMNLIEFIEDNQEGLLSAQQKDGSPQVIRAIYEQYQEDNSKLTAKEISDRIWRRYHGFDTETGRPKN